MKVCGIISEYNPFHNGHLYQIQETRRMGATHIIAIMSGNFVQRGDVAILDKFVRAQLAISCGADMVIELPTPFAMSSAEFFARGAVHLLNALGCVDNISFGSECGDINKLRKAAEASEKFTNSEELIALLKEGRSYPPALQSLATAAYGTEVGDIFSHPNNLLGIEYLKAIERLNSPITPLTIYRKAAAHDSPVTDGNIASASYVRRAVNENASYKNFLPTQVYNALKDASISGHIASLSNLERAILYHFRSLPAGEIKRIPDVSHGLENRIALAARTAKNLEELQFAIKSKRYTLARIRRILLSGLLRLDEKYRTVLPPYARILSMNEAGCEILRMAKKTAEIPIGTQLLKLAQAGSLPKWFVDFEAASTDIYALSTQKIRPCGLEYTTKIQQLK